MSFNEDQFRRLVDETERTIIALGTTSQAVHIRHRRFTEQLVSFLREIDCEFDLQLCLGYVNTLEHDPASKLNSSYVDWIAFHRFVHLLAEQEQGILTSWRHYLTKKPPILQSSEFNDVLQKYAEYESSELGLKKDTVKGRESWIRKMFLYFESHDRYSLNELTPADISGYLLSDRFRGRTPKGVHSEWYCLKNFWIYAEEHGLVDTMSLHSAIIIHRVNSSRIITTLTHQQEADILEDEPDSSVNKRDIAIGLLALHTGLRSCDIRALKFQDIVWDKQYISLLYPLPSKQKYGRLPVFYSKP